MTEIKNNYYGMLGLSAENYEGDPKKLSEIAERSIKEWLSHKELEVQNRANIHGVEIRKAISDSIRWKRIYDEYKEAIISNIEDMLALVVCDHKISKKNIKNISGKNKVSEGFVEGICRKKGYRIVEYSFTLEDLKPKSFFQILEPQKAIVQLGVDNLIDLLSTAEISEICIVISESTSKDRVLEALEELHKKWAPIPQNGPKGSQKACIERIYAGFTNFLKDNQISQYTQCLKYIGAKRFLDMITSLGIKELSDEAVNFAVNRLTEFTEDFDKSYGVLQNFCISKGIDMHR